MTRLKLKVQEYVFYGSVLQIRPLYWEWVISDTSGIVDSGVTLTRKGGIKALVRAAEQEATLREELVKGHGLW